MSSQQAKVRRSMLASQHTAIAAMLTAIILPFPAQAMKGAKPRRFFGPGEVAATGPNADKARAHCAQISCALLVDHVNIRLKVHQAAMQAAAPNATILVWSKPTSLQALSAPLEELARHATAGRQVVVLAARKIPTVAGVDIARAVRQHPQLARVPILIHSSDAAGHAYAAEHAGANALVDSVSELQPERFAITVGAILADQHSNDEDR